MRSVLRTRSSGWFFALLLAAILPWGSAQAATVVNNTPATLTCNFGTCTFSTGATCGPMTTCTLSGPGFAVLASNQSVLFTSTGMDGTCNNIIGTGCNPQLGVPGTMHVAVARTATLSQSGGTMAEAGGVANYAVTLNGTTTVPVTVTLSNAGTASNGADFVRSTTTIVIPPGAINGFASATAVQDSIDEADESLVTNMSVYYGSAGSPSSATATIVDDDAPPNVTLGISATSLPETGGTATVTATLSAISGLPVTVNLVKSGTTNASDYNLTSTTINIPAGSINGSVTLTATNNGAAEPNETVILDIGSATNANEVGTQQVTATIVDDDVPAATVSLTLTGSPLNETGGVATVTAALTAPVATPVVVNLGFAGTANSPGDYTRSAVSITIPTGSVTGTISLNATSDLTDETNETVIVDITAVTGATENGAQVVTATITDDDPAPAVTLGLGGSPFAENGGVATVTATLSNPSVNAVTVTLGFAGTATNTTDYTRSSGSIIIAAGATSGTVTLTGVNNATPEPAETVIVDITGVTNGTESGTQQVTATITDDDQPTVTLGLSGSTLAENGGATVVTATLSAASPVAVTVNLAFAGTANNPADYIRSGTSITINAGGTSGTVDVASINDGVYEGNETVIVDIASVTNGTESGIQQVIATITDDDAAPVASIGLSGSPMAENGGVTTVTATLTNASSSVVTVNLGLLPNGINGATHPVDYTPAAFAINVPAGSLSASISLTAVNDAIDEADETFSIQIIGVTNGTSSGAAPLIATITDDDAAPTVTLGLTGSPFAENGGVATVTATLSAASGQAVNVALTYGGSATNATDYTPTGASILIAAGATTGTVTLTGVDDPTDELAETVIVDIGGVTNGTESGTQQVTASITDDDVVSVTIGLSGSPLAENNGVAIITATLSAPAAADVTVTLGYTGTASDPADYVSSGTTITVLAGAYTGIAQIFAIDDAIDEADETVIADITGVTNGNETGTQQVTATIADDDPPPVATIDGAVAVDEGGTLTYTVHLDRTSSSDLVLALSYAGTAGASDYTAPPATLTIPAGNTTGTVDVASIDDGVYEGDETVDVTIDTGTGYTPGGAATGIGILVETTPTPQAITGFAATPSAPTYAPAGTFALSATGGGSGNPVVYASTSPLFCSVSGDTVTMLAAGTCSLTANQAGTLGSPGYSAAPEVTLDVTIAQAGQLITGFAASPSAPTYAPGGTFVLSATGGASTSMVTYDTTSPLVCSVAGDTVTMLAAGTCALTADQAGDANYTAAPQVTLDVGIGKAAQAITAFAATPSAPTYSVGGTFSLAANGGASTSLVVFATTSPLVCNVAGSTVTMLTAGTCALTADQAGDANYSAAPQVTLDVAIGQAAQAITGFMATPSAPTFAPGGTFVLAATSGASTSPVVFASTSPGICSVSGSDVTMLSAGTCALTADQAGDINYTAAQQVAIDVSIGQATQAITGFAATPSAPSFSAGGTFEVSAINGASTSPVVFAVTSPGICSVSGSTVTMLAAGTCALTADQAGDANYTAAPQVTLDVAIGPGAQAITGFVASPAVPTYSSGGTFQVFATGGASTSPVVFASTSPGTCSVVGGNVTILAAGTCSLTADQAGDANYNAAPQVTLDVTIDLASQAIIGFAASPSAPTFSPGGTFSLLGDGGDSTSPVVFASSSPDICSVAGNTVTMLAAGFCDLTADQAGDANYRAALQEAINVLIGQATQAITAFVATPSAPVFAPGGTFDVSAIAGASTSPLVFASTSAGTCSVSGSTVTMLAAGNCALTADQAGDANYTAAPQVTLDVAISQGNQAITAFAATPATPTFAPGGTFTLSAIAGASTSPVVFGSTTTGVCTVAGNTVTMLAAGNCSLTADQAADADYNAAPQVSIDVGIDTAAQAITGFAATPAAPTFAPGGSFSVTATGGASTSPVVFASSSPGICSVSGTTVNMLAAGTCALTADQNSDSNYDAAPQVTLDVAIGLATQTITGFAATPATPTFAPGGTFAIAATGGASTSAVVFASTSPGICSVSGNTVTMVSAGNCALTADQAGDANYSAAPQVTLDVAIGLAAQAITAFAATPATPTFAPGGTFAIAATAGASTSPVVFASASPGICSVSGGTVTMVSAGTCALTADQAGDANYNAAPQVTLDVAIGQATQAITAFAANPASPTFAVDGTFTLSATAGASTSPVVFASTSPGICSVSGDTVTMLAAGTCALTADQAGDANYAAAPQVTLDVAIGQAAQAITAFASTPVAPTFAPGGTFTLSATGGASANPVTFAGTSPSICTVSGNTVTMLAAGNCALIADQAGDADYSAAPQVTLDVAIGLATQEITAFAATPANPTFAPGGTFTVAATPGASTSPVVFASTSAAICTVSGNTVTMLTAGTCALTADQAGDANYDAAPQVTLDVSIGQATQAITAFAATPTTPVFAPDGTFTVAAIGGASTSPVVFASTSASVCTVAGNTVTMLTAGNCALTADQAGDANYGAAPQVTLDVAIGPAIQAITGFAATPATPVFAPGGTFTVAATGGASTSPVVFASTSAAICTVSGDTVTMLTAGTCALTADQAGDANYDAAAQVTLDVAIGLAAQSITGFATIPAAPEFSAGGTFAVTATGGASTSPIVFASTSPAVCTVSGSTVTMLAIGTCTLTADQAGDASYSAAPQATLVVDLTMVVPNLDWIGDLVRTLGEPDFDLPDPSTNSPGVFAFSSSNADVAAISGRRVVLNGAGITTLTATVTRVGAFLGASISVQLTVSARPDPTKDASVVSDLQSQVDTSVRFAAGQIDNIQGRLSQLRAGEGNPSSNGLALQLMGADGASLPLSADQFGSTGFGKLPEGWGVWTAGSVNAGEHDANGVASGFEFRSDGLTLGVDKLLGEDFLLGGALGFGWMDVDHDQSASALDAEYWSAAMYGLWQGDGRWFVDGLAGWGQLEYDIDRDSALVSGIAKARRDGDQLFGALTLGYQHQAALSGLTSYLRLDSSHTTLDAYRELGLGIYDLAIGEQDVNSTTMAVGLEKRYAFTTSSANINPFWSVEYREALTNSSEVGINYAIRPVATDYTLALRSYDDDVLSIGAGVDVFLKSGWSLSFLMNHQEGSTDSDTGVGIRASYSFGDLADPVGAPTILPEALPQRHP